MTITHRVPSNGRDRCTDCGFLIPFPGIQTVVMYEQDDGLHYETLHPHCFAATPHRTPPERIST